MAGKNKGNINSHAGTGGVNVNKVGAGHVGDNVLGDKPKAPPVSPAPKQSGNAPSGAAPAIDNSAAERAAAEAEAAKAEAAAKNESQHRAADRKNAQAAVADQRERRDAQAAPKKDNKLSPAAMARKAARESAARKVEEDKKNNRPSAIVQDIFVPDTRPEPAVPQLDDTANAVPADENKPRSVGSIGPDPTPEFTQEDYDRRILWEQMMAEGIDATREDVDRAYAEGTADNVINDYRQKANQQSGNQSSSKKPPRNNTNRTQQDYRSSRMSDTQIGRSLDKLAYKNIFRKKGESVDDAIARNRDFVYNSNVLNKHEVPYMKPGAAESIANEDGALNVQAVKRFAASKAAELTRKIRLTGGLFVEGTTVDKEGNLIFPEIVKKGYDWIMATYHCSMCDAAGLIMDRLGISVDNDGTIMGQDPDKFRLTEEQFAMALAAIDDAQKRSGHPLGYSPIRIVIGDSVRFPVSFYSGRMAKRLTQEGSILSHMSAFDLIKKGMNDWNTTIKPNIMANCVGDKLNQRYALENMMRAYISMDERIDPSRYQLSPLEQATFDELMDQARQAQKDDPDYKDVYEAQEKKMREASIRLTRQLKRELNTKDENGNTMYRDKNGFEKFLMGTGNIMRFMGTVGDPVILATGVIEHATGILSTVGANAIISRTAVINSDYSITSNPEYGMTETIKRWCFSDEAKEAILTYRMLERVGGREAQIVFSQSGMTPTRENAKKLIQERSQDSDQGKAERASQWMAQITDKLMVGDIFGLTKQDVYLWAQVFVYNMGVSAEEGRPAFTSKELEGMIMQGGMGNFISQAMITDEGRDAFVATSNLNLGRISPLGYFIRKIFLANGIVNFTVTTSIDTFIMYGANWIQNFFPFTNTFSYLTVRAFSKEGANIRDYQLAGNDNFWRGLYRNMVYDFMKMANFGLIALLTYAVLKTIGIEPPDDDEDKFNPFAYRIGGNLGWGTDVDQDGKGDGLIVAPTWWMNDLVGWGLPLGIAAAVQEQTGDNELAWNLLMDGSAHMIDGASLLDMVKLLSNLPEEINTFNEIMTHEVEGKPDGFEANIWMAAESLMAQFLGKMTPGVIKRAMSDTFLIGRDRADATPSYEWNLSTEDPTDVQYIQDPAERKRRSMAKNNPLYAGLLNLFHSFGNEKFNSYFSWDMPKGTMDETVSSVWREALEIYPDKDPNIPQTKEERQAWLDNSAAELINLIEQTWESPAQAAASGFMIPYNRRIAAIEYCYGQIARLEEDFIVQSESGAYPTYIASKAAENVKKDKQSKYYKLLSDWFRNDLIPWKVTGYEKEITDYDYVYRWKDSNELANGMDYLNPINAGKIEREAKPRGNHPTSLFPFTIVDEAGKGYNAEEVANYYVPGITDAEKVKATIKGKTLEYGRFAGEDLSEVLFKDPGGVPTMGLRGYHDLEPDPLPVEITGITLDSVAKNLGIDMDALKAREDAIKSGKSGGGKGYSRGYGGSRYNYPRSYNSSGGSTKYNPKIYSNSKNINAPRAASMYIKQPYGATVDYLRPSFSTKGSREAYKRQDM